MHGRAERSTTPGTNRNSVTPLANWSPTLPQVAIGLALAVVLRTALAAWTIQQGYIEYNADGFARIIRGWEWLQAPRWEVEVWLPLHFWLYGGVLAVWENLLLAPRVLNFSLSLITVLLLYGIGVRLMDRRAGLLAALLGALFPYEIWLSLSGMSEPLFHVLIALAAFGFVSWWIGHGSWTLLVAGLAIGAATAVRYEGWFYAAAFVPLAIGGAWYLRRDLRFAALACLLAAAFMGVWMQQSWQVHGDPVAFASQTEAIKEAENPDAADASMLERVTFFPEAALRAAPAVVLFGLAATAGLLWWNLWRWGPYLALVWGQAVLLVGVTSMFSNEGPGAERYLLSNTVLLLVPIAAGIWLLIDRFRLPGLLGAGAIGCLLLVSSLPDWRFPPVGYPDEDTREMASTIEGELDESDNGDAIVLLPGIPNERFNEGYAFRVLSGYPGRVEITDLPSRMYEAVQEGTATVWVMDSSVEANSPPALERAEIGGYLSGNPPPPAAASTRDPDASSGGSISVNGSDFLPEEPVTTWWTAPDGAVYEGPDLESDAEGEIGGASVSLPDDAVPGTWSLTLAGQESQRRAYVDIEVGQ